MFLLRPTPLIGESLSSWRQRAGLANGFRLFPRPRGRYTFDEPDRLPDENEEQWLVEGFGVIKPQLLACSLNAMAEGVFGPLGTTVSIPWILRLGTLRPMSAFCPLCLAEDRLPYFRLHWRLSFVTHCPRHDVLMQQGCPACTSPVWPTAMVGISRRGGGLVEIDHCPVCGERYTVAEVVQADASLVRTHLAVASTRASPIGGIDCPQYFAGMRSVCQLLIRKGGYALPSQIPLPLPEGSDGQPIEYFAPFERAQYIAAADWLLAEWPHRFVEACRRTGVSKQIFRGMTHQLPYWVRRVVEEHLTRAPRSYSDAEVVEVAQQLKRQGIRPTKGAVLRLLGASVSLAINRTLSRRKKATRQECTELLARMVSRARNAPRDRGESRTWARDCLIVLVSALTGSRTETVCLLSFSDACAVVSESNLLSAGVEPSDFRELFASYVAMSQELRDQFRLTPADPFFLERSGKATSIHRAHDRVSECMQDGFDPMLYKSANVFAGALRLLPGHNDCSRSES